MQERNANISVNNRKEVEPMAAALEKKETRASAVTHATVKMTLALITVFLAMMKEIMIAEVQMTKASAAMNVTATTILATVSASPVMMRDLTTAVVVKRTSAATPVKAQMILAGINASRATMDMKDKTVA